MLKRIVITMILVTTLSACTNSGFDKEMEQGKLALANGEYDKALASIELALGSKENDSEANSLKADLLKFEYINQSIDAGDLESALEEAETLLSKDVLVIGLRKPLEKLVDTVKKNQAISNKVASHIAEIDKSVDAQNYQEAQLSISELQNSQEAEIVMEQFREKLVQLEQRLETELEKQKVSTALETAISTPSVPDKISTGLVSQREEYIRKLETILEGLSDLDYLFVDGTTMDMKKAEGERFIRWDDALNEIYSVLKKQLSEKEMNELRQKQREWIKYRDLTASTNAAEFVGGTFETLTYTGTLANLTHERCYELVYLYMK